MDKLWVLIIFSTSTWEHFELMWHLMAIFYNSHKFQFSKLLDYIHMFCIKAKLWFSLIITLSLGGYRDLQRSISKFKPREQMFQRHLYLTTVYSSEATHIKTKCKHMVCSTNRIILRLLKHWKDRKLKFPLVGLCSTLVWWINGLLVNSQSFTLSLQSFFVFSCLSFYTARKTRIKKTTKFLKGALWRSWAKG